MSNIEKPASHCNKVKPFLNIALILLATFIFHSCQSKAANENTAKSTSATSIDNKTSARSGDQNPTDKYELAKKAYLENKSDPDALIWYGRRTAYIGQYQEAINLYTKGIELHPNDARMYRHRGHRYISLRKYDEAISDLESAVTLISDQQDKIEPDGLPNARNIPIGTLHGNIWYHLGLAYYLKNDMENALRAYSNRTVTEKYDDNIVSGGHWLYMILSRLGNVEAADAAIAEVTHDMDIIENFSYHKMCLFYKGLIQEEDLQSKDPQSSADNVLTYSLGNWYLYQKQDTAKAKTYYEQLLKDGNKYSFAYLAAEADWIRIFKD